jgi:hypothetical protein
MTEPIPTPDQTSETLSAFDRSLIGIEELADELRDEMTSDQEQKHPVELIFGEILHEDISPDRLRPYLTNPTTPITTSDPLAQAAKKMGDWEYPAPLPPPCLVCGFDFLQGGQVNRDRTEPTSDPLEHEPERYQELEPILDEIWKKLDETSPEKALETPNFCQIQKSLNQSPEASDRLLELRLNDLNQQLDVFRHRVDSLFVTVAKLGSKVESDFIVGNIETQKPSICNSQKPAFPCNQDANEWETTGLTKREWMLGKALEGLAENPEITSRFTSSELAFQLGKLANTLVNEVFLQAEGF